MATISTSTCDNCKVKLPDAHSGVCPKCGHLGKNTEIQINDSLAVSDSFSWRTTREFYEKNKPILTVIVVLSIISPLVGVVLAGVPGIIVGFLISGFCYFLSPRAIIKIREIENGS